jgi:hypothetical protein
LRFFRKRVPASQAIGVFMFSAHHGGVFLPVTGDKRTDAEKLFPFYIVTL